MFDLQEGEGPDSDHICSSNPVYQPDGNSVTTKTSDFNFWDDRIREGYENHEEDDYTAYSPPLWSRNVVDRASLLQCNHHSSNLSPTTRFQAIVEGRKELMGMALNVPELSIELSLRDIVSDQQKTIVVHEEKIASIQNKPKPKKKKKNSKRGHLLRSESMDSGVFLLKMFLPTSLCSSKSRVARSPSHDGFLKAVNTVWWKIGLLSENKNSGSSGSSRRSTGSISSTRSSEEIPVAIKPFKTFQKEKRLEENDFSGAMFEGKFYAPEDFKALENMPTRAEIYANLLGSLKGPVTAVVGTLQAPVRNLVLTLKAYVKKLEEEEGGGAQ